MKKLIFTCAVLIFKALLYAQQPAKEMKLSELFLKNEISIFNIASKNSNFSLFDTITISFTLTNNFNTDTLIYYTEGYCDWYSFTATPVNVAKLLYTKLAAENILAKYHTRMCITRRKNYYWLQILLIIVLYNGKATVTTKVVPALHCLRLLLILQIKSL